MNLQTFTLTPPNAVALEQYAELAGVTPQEFLNAFLAEFLVERFGDPQVGDAEPFLLGFLFKQREKAERLAEWIRKRDPELEIAIRESREGFKVRATYMFDGRVNEICP